MALVLRIHIQWEPSGPAGRPREIHPGEGGRGRFRRVAEPLVLPERTRSTRCSSATRPGAAGRRIAVEHARPRSRCRARLQSPRATARSGRRGARDEPGTRWSPAPRCGRAIRIDRCRGWHPRAQAPLPQPSVARQHRKRRTVATCVCSLPVRTKPLPCLYRMHRPYAMNRRGSLIVKTPVTWAQRDLNPRPSDYESAALTA